MAEGINIEGYKPIIADEAYRKDSIVRVQTNLIDPKTWKPALKEMPVSEVIIIRRITSPDAEDVLEKIVELSADAFQGYERRIDASAPKEEFDKLDIEIGEDYKIIHGNTTRYPVLKDEKGYKHISSIKLTPDGEGSVDIEMPDPLEREAMTHLLDTPRDALGQILHEVEHPAKENGGIHGIIKQIMPESQDVVIISYGVLPREMLDECGDDCEKIVEELMNPNARKSNFGLRESVSIPVVNGRLEDKSKANETLKNYFNAKAQQFASIPVPMIAVSKLNNLKAAGSAVKRAVNGLYATNLEDVEQEILPLEISVLETAARLRLNCRRIESKGMLATMKAKALEEQKKEKAEQEKAMRRDMDEMRMEIQEKADSYLSSLLGKK
ncbi:MAG: hypothetical protein PHO02_01075 [Candidatus Nanoarchaeia archaeon]|nr:hypothetical protein [Candidatus Nanoarchaeia archaeon]